MHKFQGLVASVVDPVRTTRKYRKGSSALGPVMGQDANWPGLHTVQSFSWTLKFFQLFPSSEPWKSHTWLINLPFEQKKYTTQDLWVTIVYLNIPTSRKGLGTILPQRIVVAHKLQKWFSLFNQILSNKVMMFSQVKFYKATCSKCVTRPIAP